MAEAVEEEWDESDWIEMLQAIRLLQDYTRDRTWECVLWSRHNGQTWDQIGGALGMSRQSVWERYQDVDKSRGVVGSNGTAGMEGRQAHFEEVLMGALDVRWAGAAVELSDLYDFIEVEAAPGWVDSQPCRHNNSPYEWQHDVRWSLLKLKAKGKLTQPRRGWYESS